MNYTPNFQKSPQSFVQVLKKAKDWFDNLPEKEQKRLKESLEHGAGHLTNRKELITYLNAYGEIHKDKLLLAYNRIPMKVWGEDGISIVDYGCGQGIAEMVLSDYLDSKYHNNDFVKEIILIEPSYINLIQAKEYAEAFFPNTLIKAIHKTDAQITVDDIKTNKSTVLHIFSNVIDLDTFDGKRIADLLSNDYNHSNIIICVSPFYQEDSRGKRMYEFGENLRGYTLEYKVEKHTDDWDKPYSCQMHLYVSSYY